MTPEELTGIDRKVAEACGIRYCLEKNGMPRPPTSLLSSAGEFLALRLGRTPFRPSTDWNDAMFAAEKAGLFDGEPDQCGELFRLSRDWDGWDAERMAGQCINGSSHISGPLAICQCILRFKGKS